MQWILLIVALIVVALVFFSRSKQMPVEEAVRHLKEDAVLVDVRTPSEFAQSRVPGARNIPLSSLENGFSSNNWPKDKTILLHCASGARSGSAVSKLKQMGYTNVWNIGGFSRASQIAETVADLKERND